MVFGLREPNRHLKNEGSACGPLKGEVSLPYYTLDEVAESMEAQARKDKALAVKCIGGLTQYAAGLRQKAGSGGQERIEDLRELVGCLACYWCLEDEPGGMDEAGYQDIFDRRVAEAGEADRPWSPSPEQKSDTVYGLYCYAMDLIPNLGADAQEDILGSRDLIREIEQFWDFGSPVLDRMCVDIETALQAQAAREAELEMGGIQ